MKPYYEQDGITIYHGDCREIMPLLDAESVNLIVTSPPYNVGLRYANYCDKLPDEDHRQLVAGWLGESFRVMADTGRLYAAVSDQMLWWVRDLAEVAGWRWGQLMPWCKPNFAGGTARMAGDWNNMTEWIMLFRKGKRTPMQNGHGNTHNYFVVPSPQSTWVDDQKQHPAQWPRALARRIISRTPGDVLLDPFMGSGAIVRAAKDLGRTAIGIDVDEASCEIAAKRMSQGVLL